MEEDDNPIQEDTSASEFAPGLADRNVSDLQQRCKTILEELQQFENLMNKKKKSNQVELRRFRGGLLSELKSLERVNKHQGRSDHST